MWYGTVVSIGCDQHGRNIFLSAGHNFRESHHGILIGFNREWHAAKVLKREESESCDLAVLAVDGNHNLPSYPVCDGDPAEGVKVVLFGYRGRRYTRENGSAFNLRGTMHWFKAKAYQGMSGGPVVIDDDGFAKTIAIIGGGDARDRSRTWATGLPKIREFIDELGLEIVGCKKPEREKPRPQETPRPITTVEIDYNKLAILIIARMKADQSFRGEKGATGETGSPGKQGKTGSDGSSGKQSTLDYDKLVKAVIEKLPPFRMEIQHPNGEVKYQEKKLGEIIAIKLVPVK